MNHLKLFCHSSGGCLATDARRDTNKRRQLMAVTLTAEVDHVSLTRADIETNT